MVILCQQQCLRSMEKFKHLKTDGNAQTTHSSVFFPDENIGASSKVLQANTEDISPLLESLRSGGGGGRKDGQKGSHDKAST